MLECNAQTLILPPFGPKRWDVTLRGGVQVHRRRRRTRCGRGEGGLEGRLEAAEEFRGGWCGESAAGGGGCGGRAGLEFEGGASLLPPLRPVVLLPLLFFSI
jgi:hypothetical protein